ncbi:VWA domain-containing protein [Reichenbachiella carrageenanivorans]|uniref:VWA domain-containing protein n=1 Tax=Reichenbachiella carrageenanivorans TaxID=2979869 RepID=A0ABY6D576_9BACT|nr:VWA domain-containing protein [Reichenbachiella carrageenanivorans]UXX81248.1 VWA domain-containing protein [Reichenbachiella carrageenanivorans]
MPDLIIEQSVWYIPLCLLLAAGISYLVYTKKAPWGRVTNGLLAGLRFVLIFLLALLLLNPLLNQLVQEVEQPSFVIAVDNSESMVQGEDSLAIKNLMTSVEQLRSRLASRQFVVDIHTLNAKGVAPNAIIFDQKTTNLDRWLRDIQSDYEGKNLGGVYLISDGKYNQGTSPAYYPYNYKVFALGAGDTTQQQDLVLQNVLYNKIAYQGNRFPVVVEIVNHGYANQKARLEIRSNGKVLAQKEVKFKTKEGLTAVELEVDAGEKGMQQLDLRLQVLEDEATTSNNFRRIFVDVVDGKQKILLVAPTPHPDIKMLAAVIEKNQNYELTIYVPGLTEPKTEKYDLVIAHQAYSRYAKANDAVKDQRKKGVPVLMIFGERSNVLVASRTEELFTLKQKGAKRDLIFGAVNDDFSLFSMSDDIRTNFRNYPPVSVPYGDVLLPANAEVLLYQRVGSIQTDKPLMYLNEQNGVKSAFLLAEGFWKWRMQEIATTDASDSFDDLFLKTIQYLSTKVDKRKFKFYPSSNTYFENETVSFHAEIYNQIYERIYGLQIGVTIADERGMVKEYNFTPSSTYSRLEISSLVPGLYSYKAKVDLNGKSEVVRGKFSIKELQLETLDQVADFDLLRQLAHHTEGRFYTSMDQLLADVDHAELKGVIHTQEDIFPVIHLKWILFVLLTLATVEWFIRKYNGGY